jgi:Fe-S-cluster containining protein
MDAAQKEARKAELFTQLETAHDLLTSYQEEHKKTGYGCVRSGHCCQVGLQLHVMECEHIANQLRAQHEGDPKGLARVVKALERAFDDEAWNWGSAIGDFNCAFYKDGCTIYPFRPSICRMYGVVLAVDEWCPRERLSSGDSFVYVQKDVDRMIALYYRTLDNYGRLYPKLDYTVYMPAGVLSFLLPPKKLEALRARTDKKFWKRERGYRTQYQPSYRAPPRLQTNVKFPFAIPK